MKIKKYFYVLFFFIAFETFSFADEIYPLRGIEIMDSGFYWPLGKEKYPTACNNWLAKSWDGGCYLKSDTGGDQYHIGVDMMASINDYIFPVCNGIIYDRSSGGWGNGNVAVLIKHRDIQGNAFLALYGHIKLFKKDDGSTLNVGDRVWGGVPFAQIGYWSSGIHLHFGIHPQISIPNKFGIMPKSSWSATDGFVDPLAFLKSHQSEPATDFVEWQECVLEGSSLCDDLPEQKVLGWMMDNSSLDESVQELIRPLLDTPSNSYIYSTDIHITHCKIRPYKTGDWRHEVEVEMKAGEAFKFELEGRVRNESDHDLEDVDIDYCFVKDKKDFDVSSNERMRLDDDQVDIAEGEKESKHSGLSRVSLSSDLTKMTVSTDDGASFTLPITQDNITRGEITLYFYLDAETEDGDDRDVSDEAKTDEYAKIKITLANENHTIGTRNITLQQKAAIIAIIKMLLLNEETNNN